MPKRIDTPEYWISEFKTTPKDMEAVYGYVLEVMRPLDIETLTAWLVRSHAERLTAVHRVADATRSLIYQPSQQYEVGQRLVFPALDGAHGEVRASRPGNNDAYGTYEVIEVAMAEGGRRSFAAALSVEHVLNQQPVEVDPEALSQSFAPLVVPRLAEELQADPEWAHFGNRWVLRALLPEIHTGHRNLAEAIVMLAGEPLPAEHILQDLDLDPTVPVETRAMALDIALSEDDRFRNVGALEAPLWALRS